MLLSLESMAAAVKTSPACLESKAVKETGALISELCRSIIVKFLDHPILKPHHLIIMPPSGVQEEEMEPEDMYVSSQSGSSLSAPSSKPYIHKPPKCSDCGPLFMKAYEMHDAGTVICSHRIESCLLTMINPLSKVFWADCYHYLVDAAVKLQLGLDWSTPNHGPIQDVGGLRIAGESCIKKKKRIAGESNVSVKARKANDEIDPFPCCIVLDIEGTNTPISFVSEVLFPYAHDNVRRHLSATYDAPETQADIKLLHSQGHIWHAGYENNELQRIVFYDVPVALEKWHALGIKVSIYTSRSSLVQRLLFGHTNYGDLRKYVSGFFDTTVGNKREIHSYVDISESLGVDKPSHILFVTDVFQEATATKAAGLKVIISIRPGNVPLPENHGFKKTNSLSRSGE